MIFSLLIIGYEERANNLQGNRTATKIFVYIKPSTSRKLQLFYIDHVPADANAQKTRENEIRPPSALNI